MTSGTFTTASSSMNFNSPRFIGAVEDEWQLYSDRESDYIIGSPIGFGASSIVYAATYQPPRPKPSANLPPPIPCALKVLDLDALPPRSLSLLQRETTLMSLSKHPNVLRVRGSWMNGHKLYIALRLMNKGSAADVMRYGWPGGMEEDVVRCILRQALQGLNYLHINGFIHRDIKAANLLIDDDGTVLLGDLGVAADLSEDTSQRNTKTTRASATTALSQPDPSDIPSNGGHSGAPKRIVLFDHTLPLVEKPRMGKRKSFVGTPCWMAPELIQGRQYDSSADIWSFGITALELTQGRPPRSRETPQRVLLRTIQDEPPTLNREGGTYKYSRAFKEMVDSCLVKDPTMRPTAQELLEMPFFKASKKKSYLVSAILKNLPPLTQRQERCVARNSTSMHSLDSWDFASTMLHVGSPVPHPRRLMEDLNCYNEPTNVNGLLDMEEDTEESRRHQSVSWANDTDILNDPERKSSYPLILSSPLDTDSADTTSSSPSSSIRSDSPSSSASGPKPHSGSATVNESSGIRTNTVTEKIPIMKSDSQSSSNISSSVTSSSPPSSFLSSSPGHVPSSLSSRKGLWQKVKSNVRKKVSHMDLVESEGHSYSTPVSSAKEKSSRWRSGSLRG